MTKTGNIESGSVEKIAVWMLDTDYDGRSIFPRQRVFEKFCGVRFYANLLTMILIMAR